MNIVFPKHSMYINKLAAGMQNFCKHYNAFQAKLHIVLHWCNNIKNNFIVSKILLLLIKKKKKSSPTINNVT